MKKKHELREPLPEVGEFVRLIRSRLSSGEPLDHNGIWFSHGGEGSLFLDADEAAAYTQVVTQLMKTHVPRDDLSRRSVESFLQDALFAALDLRSRGTSSFDQRLRAALDRLLSRLKAPPGSFKCWVPVEGLKLDSATARFGGIAFVKFGRHQLPRPSRRPPLGGHSWSRKHNVNALRAGNTWGSVCAAVNVTARDSASAEARAQRRTRQVLDILNVFTDLVPFCNGWLYLRGETTPSRQAVPIQSRDGNLTTSLSALDPLAEVSWKSLRSAKHIARPFRIFGQLAHGDNGADNCATLLLSAAQWAGRATIDRRREQSFLLYAIALETLLLPATETQGLGHRVRLRAAHLLGKTIAARERIAKDVGRLYGIRSKIVHAGSYDVTDEDLGRLRAIVKGALFRVALTPKTHSLSRQQLGEWLDRALLR